MKNVWKMSLLFIVHSYKSQPIIDRIQSHSTSAITDWYDSFDCVLTRTDVLAPLHHGALQRVSRRRPHFLFIPSFLCPLVLQSLFISIGARWNIMVLSYWSIENRTRTFHKMVSPVLNCILRKLVWRARQSSRLTSCFCNLDIEYLYWECLGWHGWNCITYCTAALDFLNIAMSSTTSPLSSTTTTLIATIATTTTTTPTEFFLMVICKQKAATVMMTASHRPSVGLVEQS